MWSVDFFRCESLILKTHWAMVVMDQYTGKIIGFAVQVGVLDSPAARRMLNRVVAETEGTPNALSGDHDALSDLHRWKANPRILEITSMKTRHAGSDLPQTVGG